MTRRWVMLAALAVTCLSIPSVQAAGNIPGHVKPTQYTLAAATPTAMPMVAGTCGYYVLNGDSANVYVGFDTTVTAIDGGSGGIIIAPGGIYAPTLTYSPGPPVAGTQIYLYSTSGTATLSITWAVSC